VTFGTAPVSIIHPELSLDLQPESVRPIRRMLQYQHGNVHDSERCQFLYRHTVSEPNGVSELHTAGRLLLLQRWVRNDNSQRLLWRALVSVRGLQFKPMSGWSATWRVL